MSKIRGNKTLSGTWGEVWVDGEKIFELSKVELKITANREDVQLGLDVDSKMTGLKGELTLTTKKVYSRYNAVFENWKKGIDQRSQIITKLPLITMEMGGIIEQEVSGGFTPSDLVNLDKIA